MLFFTWRQALQSVLSLGSSHRTRRRKMADRLGAEPVAAMESRVLLSATIGNVEFQKDSASYGYVQGHFTGEVQEAVSPGMVQVEFDMDGDGYADFFAAGVSTSFSVGVETSFGAHTVKARTIDYDNNMEQTLFGDWQDVEFTVTPNPNSPPSISNLAYVKTGDAFPVVYGQITGTLVDSPLSMSYTIEVDQDGDGTADYYGFGAGGSSEFYVGYETSYGPHTVMIRAIELSDETGESLQGDWQEFTFNVLLPPNSPPGLSNLEMGWYPGTIVSPPSEFIKGALSDDLTDPWASYVVELDYNNDGVPENSYLVDPELGLSFEAYFESVRHSFAQGTVIRLRAVESTTDRGYLYGDWQDFTINYRPNEPPYFSQQSYSVQIDYAGEVFLPIAIDPDWDPITYTLPGVSGITITSGASPSFTITDPGAFRESLSAIGGQVTLVAQDGKGGSGQTTITFVTGVGSTVAQSITLNFVLDKQVWVDDNIGWASESITDLGTTTMTLSARLDQDPVSGNGLVFDPNSISFSSTSTLATGATGNMGIVGSGAASISSNGKVLSQALYQQVSSNGSSVSVTVFFTLNADGTADANDVYSLPAFSAEGTDPVAGQRYRYLVRPI